MEDTQGPDVRTAHAHRCFASFSSAVFPSSPSARGLLAHFRRRGRRAVRRTSENSTFLFSRASKCAKRTPHNRQDRFSARIAKRNKPGAIAPGLLRVLDVFSFNSLQSENCKLKNANCFFTHRKADDAEIAVFSICIF